MSKKIFLLFVLAILFTLCCCPAVFFFPLIRSAPTSKPEFPFLSSTAPTLIPPSVTITTATSNSLSPFTYAWNDRTPFQRGLSPHAQFVLGELPGATVYHLALRFGNPPNHAQGQVEIRYTNTESVSLTEIYLALFPNLLGGSLQVQETALNGHPVRPLFPDNWLMAVPLDPPLLPGEALTLRIAFNVRVPSGKVDYYHGIFGYNEGILSFAHAYPTVLVYNEEGWNNQTPDLDGDPLFADPSFYLISIEAPAHLTLVTSGVEIARLKTGEWQQVLIANGPARDFYLCAAPGWRKHSRLTADGTRVNLYVPPGVEQEIIEQGLDTAIAALEIFSRRYGPYPYTEFDIAPIVTSAGGVEYPGMTAISLDAFDWQRYYEIVIAHETAHAWFYNLVGNDTQDEPWLDEAAVQFATWQYFYDRYGAEQAQNLRLLDFELRLLMSAAQDTPIGLPVSAYEMDEYGNIVYGRGPLFFLALREEMGEETFDRFLREYVGRYAWKTARARDFHALAEEVCACELDSLFETWVYP